MEHQANNHTAEENPIRQVTDGVEQINPHEIISHKPQLSGEKEGREQRSDNEREVKWSISEHTSSDAAENTVN